jgi:hypothetical protein
MREQGEGEPEPRIRDQTRPEDKRAATQSDRR